MFGTFYSENVVREVGTCEARFFHTGCTQYVMGASIWRSFFENIPLELAIPGSFEYLHPVI